MTGRIGSRALIRALGGLFAAPLRDHGNQDARSGDTFASDLQALCARGVRVLHLYSEADEGLDRFRRSGRRSRARERDAWAVEIITGANHTFATLWSQEALLARIGGWMEGFRSDCRAPGEAFRPPPPEAG